jgi:hypothetical protein
MSLRIYFHRDRKQRQRRYITQDMPGWTVRYVERGERWAWEIHVESIGFSPSRELAVELAREALVNGTEFDLHRDPIRFHQRVIELCEKHLRPHGFEFPEHVRTSSPLGICRQDREGRIGRIDSPS